LINRLLLFVIIIFILFVPKKNGQIAAGDPSIAQIVGPGMVAGDLSIGPIVGPGMVAGDPSIGQIVGPGIALEETTTSTTTVAPVSLS